MPLPSSRHLLLIALIALPSLGAECQGCDVRMRIAGVLDVEDSECEVRAGGPLRSTGLLDLRGRNEYRASIAVDATWDVTLNEMRIFFTDESYRPLGNAPSVDFPRLTLTSGSLTANQRSAVDVVLVQEDESRALATALGTSLADPDERARVLVWLTLAGRLGEISDEYVWAVDVCHGCLVGVGTLDGERCIEDGHTLVTYDVCFPGQDAVQSRCAPADE